MSKFICYKKDLLLIIRTALIDVVQEDDDLPDAMWPSDVRGSPLDVRRDLLHAAAGR
jgi:hypothetical protein